MKLRKTKNNLINELEDLLKDVIDEASKNSTSFSNEPRCQLAYETGYLARSIKTALEILKEYKS